MLPATRDHFVQDLKELGRVKPEEKLVVAILAAAVFLWVVPSLLRSAGTYSANPLVAGLANVTEAVPAIIIFSTRQ